MSTQSKYTLLLFFKRNPALSPAEFKADYEATHAPLVMEIATKHAKGLVGYKRRYLDHEASEPALGNPFTVFGTEPPPPTVPYDMVNEVTFETREDAAAFWSVMYDAGAENRARVLADEGRLFERGQMRGVI